MYILCCRVAIYCWNAIIIIIIIVLCCGLGSGCDAATDKDGRDEGVV